MSTNNKNKKLAYKMGQLLAKIILICMCSIGIYTILSDLNIFKIMLVTDTIKSWFEIVIFNNLFIWNL